MDVYENMKKLGITLPEAPEKKGLYTLAREFSDRLVYSSGCGPDLGGVAFKKGKVGAEVSLEEGREAARNCMLNILTAAQTQVGDLNRIKSFVKLLVYVSSSTDFLDQPKVADGASQLLIDLFGPEAGTAARAAGGVAVLPGDIPVEVEALYELKD